MDVEFTESSGEEKSGEEKSSDESESGKMTSEVESDVCIRKRKVKQLSSSDETESDVCKKKMKVKHLSSDGNDTDLDIFRKKRKVQKLDSDSETDEGEKVVTRKGKVQSEKHDAKMKSNVEVKRESNIFACPQCDFTGKSSGKVYTHMAENHGMTKFEYDYCKFRTGNKMSWQITRGSTAGN